ncbi:MAG: DUF6268 family outer membrane beta-barrel protein [Planctomycetota bacterium]
MQSLLAALVLAMGPAMAGAQAPNVTPYPTTAGAASTGQAESSLFPPPAKAGGFQPDPLFRLADTSTLPAADPLGIDAQDAARRGPPGGMPPGTRPGMFQKANFTASNLPRFEDDSLGVFTAGADVTFGFPFPDRSSPLIVTPRYRALFLDGPDFVDVPSRLHEASIGLSTFRRLTDRWTFNGGIDLGVFADDQRFGDSGSFFVTGRALGIKQLTSTWKGVVGAVYVNRAGLSVFPALGLMYDDGQKQIDLIFPRPRIAWLLPGSTPKPGDQRWFFVSGEFGGGRYAVERDGGGDDTLSYGDARISIGHERKVIGGLSRRTDFGYVFARDLEYDNDGYDFALDDTLFVRTSLTY